MIERPSDSKEDLTKNEERVSYCKIKQLKDVILDSDDDDDDEKYEKYLRLNDDNIDGIEHKLAYTFKDYVADHPDSLYEEITDDTEYEGDINNGMIRNAEGIWQDKYKLKFMKNREKLRLLRRLKAEIRKKKKEERNNKLFEKPKWWMYLMKNAECIMMKCKEKKPTEEPFEEWEFNKKFVPKERIHVKHFLAKRSKINEKKRAERALTCVNFWNQIQKERKDLMKMMLAVQLKKYMLMSKKEKENKFMKKRPKETLPVILINLTYLKRKKKQCMRLVKKHFHSIIGATDEEVKQLKTKLNEVKQSFRKRNDWSEDHLISLMNLSKKVDHAEKNKNSMKEEVINYYIDGIYCMMEVHRKLAEDIRAASFREPKLFNNIYLVMKDTEIFIGEQVLIFRHLRNVLLHTEWTYLYYARMRVIRLLDEAVKKIICNGYKLQTISAERLNEIKRDQIICDEPEYKNEFIRDNPVLGRMIHTKDFCPISDHSII